MTKRPIQHTIASQAVASVSKIITRAGGIPEEVHNDYGEDLVVQTSWRGEMDTSRIWVQVKGKQQVAVKRAKTTIQISRDHILRWVSFSDLVLVILWDVSADRGWVTVPSDHFDSLEVLMSKNEKLKLPIMREEIFDEEAMRKLIWRARFTSLNARISHLAIQQQFMAGLTGENSERRSQALWNGQVHAGFEAMRFLEILPEEGITKSFDDRLRIAFGNVSRHDDTGEYTAEERFRQATLLLVLGTAEEVAGVGLPMPLGSILEEMILLHYKGHYGSIEEWRDSSFRPG